MTAPRRELATLLVLAVYFVATALAGRARARSGLAAPAVVAVVAQDDCPRNSPPILVTWLVGDSGSARFVASNAAQALRKGTPVVLTGHHLEITTHRGMPALRDRKSVV